MIHIFSFASLFIFYLIMVPDEKLKEHQMYYKSSRGKHECFAKFNGNVFSSCQNHKYHLMVGLQRESGNHQSQYRTHPSGTINVCTRFNLNLSQ